MLQRWGEFAARRHWWVCGAWIVVLVAVWAIGIGIGAKPNNNFTLPGASSQEALDLLGQSFPRRRARARPSCTTAPTAPT